MRVIIFLAIICLCASTLKAQKVAIKTDDINAPKAINLSEVKETIKYPAVAKEKKIEGRCMVKVLIDTNGDVVSIGAINGDSIFYDELKKAVMLLKFVPAYSDGIPVRCWINIPFKFSLKKNVYNLKEIYRY